VEFSAITEDAPVYAARAMKIELTAPQKRRLLNAYLHLTPWPDSAGALRRLRASGVRVITIANFSPSMLLRGAWICGCRQIGARRNRARASGAPFTARNAWRPLGQRN